MNFRTFSATLVGLFVSILTIYIMEMVGMKLFPPAEKFTITSVEDLKKMFESLPVMALVLVAIGHGLAVFLGGFTANKMHPGSIVGFIVLFSLMAFFTISNLFSLPHPLWFIITDITLLVIGGLAAWRLLKWE